MPIGGTLASTQAGFDAGRAAERLRLVVILTSPEARRHPDTARSLAFDTLTPAARALEVLCTEVRHFKAPPTPSFQS